MKKKEAIEQLITDFKNRLIANGYTSIDNLGDDMDTEIAKALKINLSRKGSND